MSGTAPVGFDPLPTRGLYVYERGSVNRMDLVRRLSLDGPVVGVGMVAALVWLGVTLTLVRAELRNFKAENQEAHAGIAKNVDGVKQDVRDVKQDVRDAKQDIRDVKQNVRMLTSHLLDRGGPAGRLTAVRRATGACVVRRPSHSSSPQASPTTPAG